MKTVKMSNDVRKDLLRVAKWFLNNHPENSSGILSYSITDNPDSDTECHHYALFWDCMIGLELRFKNYDEKELYIKKNSKHTLECLKSGIVSMEDDTKKECSNCIYEASVNKCIECKDKSEFVRVK